ncbi:MAG: nicotinamide-nucleotide amidohydrolase family protein [Candidatus Hydrogenedens sp.]|nr:nicotinamide-nucleotide amidohydrolase family protein [Candidatus Hydrogenedens sp.]
MSSAAEIVAALQQRHATLCTAESCTGGLVSAAITSVAGASNVFLGGVTAYANTAKIALLGVPESILEAHGAVSEETAAAMASGARRAFRADYAISVTGIAGPGGGTAEKPVGLVYIGAEGPARSVVRRCLFDGDRDSVRAQTVAAAFDLLKEVLD